jgi:D-3-phosphoglycerate dehydrogenase
LSLKIKIAECEDFNSEVLEYLNQYFSVDVSSCKPEELQFIFDEYDIFWFRLGYKIDQSLVLNSKRVKVIVSPVTGIDHIDEQACAIKGIQIVCLRGEYDFLKEVRATAEHTISLTLALMRLLGPAINDTKLGNWRRDKFRGNEIFNKKVGIVGLGRLGEITASIYHAFGCEVFYYDIRKVYSSHARRLNTLLEISNCDIVSIHVDYNSQTHHLINADFFSNCNPNMFFINTSRGGIVDEESLLNALVYKKIKGAALDVIQNEFEFNLQNPLTSYASKNNNLIITPHIGGNTVESFEKTEMFIARKIVSLLVFK